MEDEYLSLKYDHINNSWQQFTLIKNRQLISIEYNFGIVYGFYDKPNKIAYHNLNGPAIKYKKPTLNENYNDQYFIYGEFIGYVEQMTFEEFKIRRDKLIKEMVFT